MFVIVDAAIFAIRWSWLMTGLREMPFGIVPAIDFDNSEVVEPWR